VPQRSRGSSIPSARPKLSSSASDMIDADVFAVDQPAKPPPPSNTELAWLSVSGQPTS
jgi:hypothetical protein